MNLKTALLYLQTNPTFTKSPLFYRKVWKACLEIPPGQTRTYGWIAKKIGHPKASRAVGQALAKNPFAPVVPCHRVIRSNGTLGGYSAPGGHTRKKQLLKEEGIKLESSQRGLTKNIICII